MSLKKYSIGETIIDCKPFVHSLSDDKKKVLCDHCFETIVNTSHDCLHCHRMYYCSSDCQRSDLRWHRNECQVYNQYYNPYLKHHFHRLMLRSYLMVIEDKDLILQMKTFVLYNGKKRCFNGLKTHSQEVNCDDKRVGIFDYIYETFGYFAEEFEFVFSYKLLFHTYCRLIINRFMILGYNQMREESIGSGVYIKASVLNHSCRPNAATIYFGSTLVLKAIKSIEAGDEITINYCELELSREERQERLKQSFYFECNCFKCLNNDFNIDCNSLPKMRRKLINKTMDLRPNWTTISGLIDRYLSIGDQIYGHFHPQLILSLISVLSSKRNKCKDNQCFNELIADVHQRVELIFGSNHVISRHFRDCLKDFTFYNL